MTTRINLTKLQDDTKKGFTFPINVGKGLQDVFVKSSRKRVTKKFIQKILLSRPDIFRIEGGATVQDWTEFITRRIRPAEMTIRWFDTMNRMEIDIHGDSFGGRGGWEANVIVIKVE